MVRGREIARPGRTGVIAVLAALALALLTAGTAAAATGGAPSPSGTPSPSGSGAGAPAAEPVTGTISLLEARSSPRKTFYYGFRYPRLAFTIASDQPANDIRIDVLDAEGAVVKTFYRDDVAPEVGYQISWDGTTNEGRPARNGRYSFRIGPQAPVAAAPRYARRATSSTKLRLAFKLFAFSFPVLGKHDMGGAGARFGAGRSGHTHQGHDVIARCGLPIVAARGGRVRYSKFQSAAGNYVVIDGKGTQWDFMYAHMIRPSHLQPGDLVRTGEPIGFVGSTGSSTTCHLHFEIWGAPGWYEGGSPFDPYPFLLRWDRYS